MMGSLFFLVCQLTYNVSSYKLEQFHALSLCKEAPFFEDHIHPDCLFEDYKDEY